MLWTVFVCLFCNCINLLLPPLNTKSVEYLATLFSRPKKKTRVFRMEIPSIVLPFDHSSNLKEKIQHTVVFLIIFFMIYSIIVFSAF